MHSTINDYSSHATPHLPLSTGPLGHMSFPSRKLWRGPCLEAIKKKIQVTSVNTHHANTEFLCDLLTVYSDEKIKPPTSAYTYFEKDWRENNWL